MEQFNLNGEIMGYKKRTVVTVAIAAVLVLGSFYAGAMYEKNKLIRLGLLGPKSEKCAPANQLTGTITNKTEAGILTITRKDGTTQTVTVAATTKYGETSTGTLADIAIGQKVVVITTGVKAADGSLTADSIKPAPIDAPKKKTKKAKSETTSAPSSPAEAAPAE